MENDIRIKASRYTKMLWDEWLLQPVDPRYNIGFVYEISGTLDLYRLKRALVHYINQNPIIRSYFHQEEESLYQILKAEVNDGIDVRDYSGKVQKEIDALLQTLCEHSFNLTRAPLFKFTIIRAGHTRHYLALRFHHIIIDGTSAEKVPQEISRYYNADSIDPGRVELTSPELESYLEFEETFFATHPLDKGLEFWNRLLSGRTFDTSLPKHPQKPEEFSFSPTTIRFSLEEELTSKIVALARQNRCTLFQVMSALWSIFVQKYANQESIALLYPVSLRPGHLRHLKGYHVNSVPLIIDFSPASTFLSVLQAVKEQRDNSKPYQYVPFDRIIACYNETSPVHYGQRFNNAFNVTIVETKELMDSPIHLNGLSTKSIPGQTLVSSELHLMYKRDKDALECKICYDHGRLDHFVFDIVHKQFKLLAKRVLAAPKAEINSFSLLSDAQFRQVVHDWNRTEAPYPENKTIHALFEAQAARTPDNPAVVFRDRWLTYRRLNQKANQLAHTIRREYKALWGEAVQSGTPIGLYTRRGLDMIIGLLGILKAGGAYVPFDMADPEERLKSKINDCGCRMILTASDLLEDLIFFGETDILPLALDAYQDKIGDAPRRKSRANQHA